MERNFAFLCKGCSSTNAPNLMNVMMELRKCCNHPFLIKGAEDAILADMREQNVGSLLVHLRFIFLLMLPMLVHVRTRSMLVSK